MCHGYGMGVGGWHLNLGELTASAHVLAKDWLGCGLSSRPRWDLEGVEETEAFFVDSLERCVCTVYSKAVRLLLRLGCFVQRGTAVGVCLVRVLHGFLGGLSFSPVLATATRLVCGVTP